MKTLPRVPSKLIKIALADLELVENSKKFFLDMSEWYYKKSDGSCTVCAAGAVMAKTLDCSRTGIASHDDFPGNSDQLEAINFLRQGQIHDAFTTLNIKRPKTIPDYFQTGADYYLYDGGGASLGRMSGMDKYREDWKLQMQALAGILEAEGF